MPIPVALKPAFRIVPQLRVKELRKPRITRLNLFPRRPRVISEIEPPSMLDHPIDDAAKIGLSLFDAFRRVHNMQIANNANASARRPRKKARLIGLDESYGSIGHVNAMANEVLTHLTKNGSSESRST